MIAMKTAPLALLLCALPASAAPTSDTPAASAPAASAPAASAPAAATSATSAPASPLSVTADLRQEYLQGQDLLVLVTLTNNGTTPLTVPDLTARPWRVKFRFTLPSGQAQNRFTTPPAQEPAASWTISARGQKRVLLEVPSGSGLKEGSYTLAIEVDLGDRKETLPARPVRISAAKPVTGFLAPDTLLNERDGVVSLWLHQASEGFDLYLAVADARAPERGARNDYLLHLDRKVQPQLTAARPGDGDRFVLWATSERTLSYVRLQSGRVEGAPRTLDLPWPKVEIIGQGATDAKGNLHVPLWIPAPQGAGGELRLASVDARGKPQFRKMTSLSVRPAQIRTVVDVGGGVNVMVQRENLLDLYTLRPDYPDEVPIPGERLWAAEAGQQLLTARYGSVPQGEEQAGGLGVLVAWSQPGKIESQWVSLQGKALQRVPATPVAEGAQLLRLVPRGKEAPGLLLKGADSKLSYVEGSASATVALPAGDWELMRDAIGRPQLVSLGAKIGVQAKPLELKTPTP